MSRVQCVECGRVYSRAFKQCRSCGSRESVPVSFGGQMAVSKTRVRRGILWMVLAGVIYALFGQQASMVVPAVTLYLLPLLFLSGLGLVVFGFSGWLR